jgi:hypothetical protein
LTLHTVRPIEGARVSQRVEGCSTLSKAVQRHVDAPGGDRYYPFVEAKGYFTRRAFIPLGCKRPGGQDGAGLSRVRIHARPERIQ